MAYADDGAGAPIILVHGWAAHGGFFDDLRTRLSKTHRVLTPTLRGHPGSGHGTAELTIETLADDIAHFAETLDLKAVVALGWSMGAMALWAAAPKLGVRLGGLIVEDMSPRLTNDASWRHGIAGDYGVADIAITLKEINGDWPSYVSRFAPRMFAPGLCKEQPEVAAFATSEMSKADPENMASYWASMARQDFRAALAGMTMPMLVIHGADSQVYPDEATAFIASAAPNAERVVIQGAGHVPHLEAPDTFFNHVEAFVRKTRQPELRSGGAVP
ncbi:alpha/beta fold hydrolase [Terricaulis silvestris]|uniref:AB hydrolase superfamily protein YdjP n=1 Tax=Terricaulis silvestris TaxID=2686094 RepID=A0A6I6MPW5_9CAUL|nr:alpha/beta hydrolase [Terricaulis silvestris]QGZ96759.1 AB hydrolase superfamily protein YdjP [Terricaulis silvestris]